MDNLTPGEVNYAAYRAKRNGKTFDGREAPTWAQLDPDIKEGWEVGARAVIADYNSMREDTALTAGLPSTLDDEGTSDPEQEVYGGSEDSGV